MLCCVLLSGLLSCGKLLPSTTTPPATTTTPPVTTTTTTVDRQALKASLLTAAQEQTSGDFPSATDWLLHWGLSGFDNYKLLSIESGYDFYFIGDVPPALQTAQSLVSFFCEYFADTVDFDDSDELTGTLIDCYLAAVGDKYAHYMDQEAFADHLAGMSGTYTGIGVSVIYDKIALTLEIVTVFQDSPAEQAGIMSGDFIIAVEGETVVSLGYAEAINRIRGEADTEVTLTLRRGETELTVTCTRAEITEQTVTYRLIEQDDVRLGYVHLSQFNELTYEQFVEAVETLAAAEVAGFIFDVRGNPGGLLSSILDVLDYLLPDGYPLARYLYYDGQVNTDTGDDDHVLTLPMVVLCNQYTASAGELFTSALQDYAAEGLTEAVVVGITTYGKGTMQGLFEFIDGTALTISIGYYNPPFSDNYEGVGVAPDQSVSLPEELAGVGIHRLSYEEDLQLQAAVAVFTSAPTGGATH